MKRIATVLACVFMLLLAEVHPAHAATTYTVNSVDDPGDGVCNAAQCTLAEAITAANANTGPDEIDFAIPGSGIHTIAPSGQLPLITDTVLIDGYTQTGSSINTQTATDDAVLRIAVDGENSDAGTGLYMDGAGASGTVIRGLDLSNWSGNSILSVTASNISVTGNFIGTDTTGTVARPNYRGLYFNGGTGHILGGSTPAERNILSGNFEGGAEIGGADTSIRGNFIGTQANGTSPLGNGSSGLNIEIGGVSIGGPNTADANVIAFNGFLGAQGFDDGVTIYAQNECPILRNSFFGNKSLAIDLFPDGRTPNDAGDADVGANDLQNAPVLRKATIVGTGTTIKGKLSTAPSTQYRIEFFSNPSTDKRQARTFLGSIADATTDASGVAKFTFPTGQVTRGQFITATATDPNGNTSEVSAPVKVLRP